MMNNHLDIEEFNAWTQIARHRIVHFALICDMQNGVNPRTSLEAWRSRFRDAAPDSCWNIACGWVYAVAFSDNPNTDRFLKIGYAKNPLARKAQLAETWGELSTCWTWPAWVFSELEIHRTLSRYRVPKIVFGNGDGHTEWFLRYPVVDQLCAAFHSAWSRSWSDGDRDLEEQVKMLEAGFADVDEIDRHSNRIGQRLLAAAKGEPHNGKVEGV